MGAGRCSCMSVLASVCPREALGGVARGMPGLMLVLQQILSEQHQIRMGIPLSIVPDPVRIPIAKCPRYHFLPQSQATTDASWNPAHATTCMLKLALQTQTQSPRIWPRRVAHATCTQADLTAAGSTSAAQRSKRLPFDFLCEYHQGDRAPSLGRWCCHWRGTSKT